MRARKTEKSIHQNGGRNYKKKKVDWDKYAWKDRVTRAWEGRGGIVSTCDKNGKARIEVQERQSRPDAA